MSSRWFCRVLGEDLGPLEFRNLREMVRAGTLCEDDQVRRELAREWVRADSVIGLFRREDGSEPAEAIEAMASAVAAAPCGDAPDGRIPRRRWLSALRLSRGEAALVFGCVAVMAVLNLSPWLISLRESRRYPPKQLQRGRGVSREALATVLGPPPKEPSLPGLKEGLPQAVPGLERLAGITSFSLTADMNTVVFSAPGGLGTGYGLFLAQRKEISQPFDAPLLIESCASMHRQDSPALSPDGLLLVFVRYGPAAQLVFSARSSSRIEFGTPFPLAVPALKNSAQQAGQPQFVDNENLVFAVTDEASRQTTYRVARRAAFGFEPPREFPAIGMGPKARLSADRLRAYAGGLQGLTLAVRGSEEEVFLGGRCILAADVTGPITAPVWITPKEDVVFYCSPGKNEAGGPAHGLWMVRFY